MSDEDRPLDELPERGNGRRAYDRMRLPELRRELGVTQEVMAERLNTRQDSVSRTERRPDLKISTLRSYVEAIGGRLALFALFQDRRPVEIVGPDELDRRR